MVEISVNRNTMEMLTKEKRMESTLYWTPSINLSPRKTLLYILCHIQLTTALRYIIYIPTLRIRRPNLRILVILSKVQSWEAVVQGSRLWSVLPSILAHPFSTVASGSSTWMCCCEKNHSNGLLSFGTRDQVEVWDWECVTPLRLSSVSSGVDPTCGWCQNHPASDVTHKIHSELWRPVTRTSVSWVTGTPLCITSPTMPPESLGSYVHWNTGCLSFRKIMCLVSNYLRTRPTSVRQQLVTL